MPIFNSLFIIKCIKSKKFIYLYLQLKLDMIQLLTPASLLPTFSALNLDTDNILFVRVEQAYIARVRILKINRLTNPLFLFYLSNRTLLNKTPLFRQEENKFSSRRKYFFTKEKINFYQEESFGTSRRKFSSSLMFFYCTLLTRCKTVLRHKFT